MGTSRNRSTWLFVLAPALAGSAAATSASSAADGALPPPAARPVDFGRDVRPILTDRCLKCHGADAKKGGLRLDRKADALEGGGSGRAFEPGKSADSLLIQYVAAVDPTMVMPPKGDRLTAEQVGILRAWIDAGAEWPDDPATPADSTGTAARPRSDHWAFRPIRRPDLPATRDRDWVRTPIDAFVLARLEAEGVAPSPEADRATLLRRLSLDLIGLPPTPGEVDAFLADAGPDAYDRAVERLLASPHFGERWGRHWLDLARYADSDGYEKDSPRPNAWRYRDWVIGAINRDLPFDRFTVEQLAGDLLPDADLAVKAATGLHRNTLTNKEGGVDPEEYRIKAVVDRVNTTGTIWLGLTVGCAQCHSHKYDPITQKEYYNLFAFFNGQSEEDLPAPLPGERARFERDLAAFEARKTALEADRSKNEAALKALEKSKPTFPTSRVPALVANPNPPKTHILIRGDFLRKGDEVSPGTLAVLPPIPSNGSAPSRLDLARWLTTREHPLTARVAVNRAWQHLFGRPLVATPEDFGTRGEPPTHPGLLDWLADEFVAEGWSLKGLIRTVVRSSAYRQSSGSRPDLADRDPANLWIARQNRLRLEAEALRDAALACGGLLAPRIGGPSVRPPQPAGISDLTYANSAKWVESQGADRHRRGLYTWFQRTSPYPMLLTFDAPDANVCAVRRERSNTPLQALTLLNDATFVESAAGLARRIVEEGGAETDGRVRRAVLIALGRPATDDDLAILGRLHGRLAAEALAHPAEARRLAGVADATPDSEAADRAAWVALARALLNLDEFVTRE